MKYVLCLLALCLSTAQAEVHSLNVAWVCPQTYETSIPQFKETTVTIDTETRLISRPDLEPIMPEVIKFYYIDYSRCFEDYNQRIYAHIWQNCEKFDENPFTCARKPGLMSRYQIAHLNYEVGLPGIAQTFGTISPYEPGEATYGGLSDETIKQISSSIKNSCSLGEPFADLRALDGEFIQEHLGEALKASPHCAAKVTGQYMSLLLDSLASVQKYAADEEFNAKYAPHREKRAENAEKAFKMLLQTPAGDVIKKHRNAVRVELEAQNIVACEPLGENATRVVVGNTGTGLYEAYALPARYTLHRKADQEGAKSFLIAFNFEFVDDAEKPNAEVHKQMSERVRQCFKAVEDRLKGPNGERLALALASDHPGLPVTEKVKIRIKDSAESGTGAMSWHGEVSCPTIVHESLHHAGLSDEYMASLVPHCPIQTRKDSIMLNDDQAYDAPRSKLLFAGQFRAITEPGCIDSNQKFIFCSRLLYARDNHVKGRCTPRIQRYCADAAQWLGPVE